MMMMMMKLHQQGKYYLHAIIDNTKYRQCPNVKRCRKRCPDVKNVVKDAFRRR